MCDCNMARFVRNTNIFGRQMIHQNYFIVFKNKNKYYVPTIIIYRHAYVSQKVFNGTTTII